MKEVPTIPANESPASISRGARELALCAEKEALLALPIEQARKIKALPLRIHSFKGQRKLSVAVSKESRLESLQALRFVIKDECISLPLDDAILCEAIEIAYHLSGGDLMKAAKEIVKLSEAEQFVKPPELFHGGSVGEYLDKILLHARALGASDIHLLPSDFGSILKIRVQGEILEHSERVGSASTHQMLVNRIKVLMKAEAVSCRGLWEGSFKHAQGFSVRVSVVTTVRGEQVVLRIHGSEVLSIPELRLPAFLEEKLLSSFDSVGGIIITSGPTGSGKSTTLYAVAAEAVKRGLSVISIEDPVEVELPTISQIEVKESVSYSESFKAVLRQDPDLILVGEIRDKESALTALQAARTGHYVATTIHARTAEEIPSRLEQFALSRSDLEEVLLLGLGQRLVPQLCARCKENLNGLWQRKGCHACCGTGYGGRVPFFDALIKEEKQLSYWNENGAEVRRYVREGLIDEAAAKSIVGVEW